VARPGEGGGRLNLNIHPHYSIVEMDLISFFDILVDLTWILAMIGVTLGVVYVLVKPEENK
jgi:hypothetical protein